MHLGGWSSPLGRCLLLSLCPSPSPAAQAEGRQPGQDVQQGWGLTSSLLPRERWPRASGKAAAVPGQRAAGIGVGTAGFPAKGIHHGHNKTPAVPGWAAGRSGKMPICSNCSCPVHPVSWPSGGAPRCPTCAGPRPRGWPQGGHPLTPPISTDQQGRARCRHGNFLYWRTDLSTKVICNES